MIVNWCDGSRDLGIVPAMNPQESRLKIVVIGAHPDDPETCAGGLAAILSERHEVTLAYLTRGEAGISGVDPAEAAITRTRESLTACNLLNARPLFLGQVDGQSVFDAAARQALADQIDVLTPDIVLTHWPLDSHPDHQVCSSLVFWHWWHHGRSYELLFFEAMLGQQSSMFCPNLYADITPVIDRKHAACFAHASQNIQEIYEFSHGPMERHRGMEHGCQYAEGYIRHPGNRLARLASALS